MDTRDECRLPSKHHGSAGAATCSKNESAREGYSMRVLMLLAVMTFMMCLALEQDGQERAHQYRRRRRQMRAQTSETTHTGGRA